jgi:hypothetical protein
MIPTHQSRIHGQIKLGCHVDIKLDKRTLQFANYIDVSKLPPLPPEVNYFSKVHQKGPMLNNIYGCCTISGYGHGIEVWSANASNQQITIPDAAIETAYEKITGFDPNNAQATDNGADELAVLKYVKANGIGGYKIDAFVSIDPKNLYHVRMAAYLLGFVYNGLLLPKTCLDQETWDVVDPTLQGDSAVGSLGGHCTINPGYSLAGFSSLGGAQFPTFTWGMCLGMTQRFWDAYAFQAWGMVSKLWLQKNNLSVSGLAWQDLLSDANAIADEESN